MRTYIIGLYRSPERFAQSGKRARLVGFSPERVLAVDGNIGIDALDDASKSILGRGLDLSYWRRYHHREPLPAEIGCYLSHGMALRAFLASGDSHALIDDAPQVVEACLARDDWDVVMLHARHPGYPLGAKPLVGNTRLARFLTQPAGSTAYLITRDAAYRLLAYMAPARLPFDYVLHRSWEHRLRMRWVTPFAVELARVGSTIEVGRKRSRRSRWALSRYADAPYLPRWRVPLARLVWGMQRVGYNVATR